MGILASMLPFLATEHTDTGESTVMEKPCLHCLPWLFSTTLKGGKVQLSNNTGSKTTSFPPFSFALSIFICNFAAETIINRDSYGSIKHFI